MNFYGHAVLAATTHQASEFVLGAMLPDFISILGSRPPRLELGTLARGVAFHHRTDAAFHDCAIFRALQAEAASYLTARGVRRGPTRAVAHVGVELLIDAALARDPLLARTGSTTADECYLAALELGASPHPALAWNPVSETQRFTALCQRLRQIGVDRFRVGAEQAMTELARILDRRPRLALSDQEILPVKEWAEQAVTVVKAQLPALLDELKNRLDGHAG